MLIGGLQRLTLLDYPGHVACIIFTAGCNMRCRYCHNPELVLPEKIRACQKDFVSEADFFTFLVTRQGLLEGVVVSGGEPTVHPDLIDFIRRIKAMGFLVKLDTNGSNPDVLQKLLDENLLAYIAMDVKATKDRYRDLVQSDHFDAIERSRDLILRSGIDHECLFVGFIERTMFVGLRSFVGEHDATRSKIFATPKPSARVFGGMMGSPMSSYSSSKPSLNGH